MSSRIVRFQLGETTYPMCFTLQAAEAFFTRYQSIDGWWPRLMELSHQEEEDEETGEVVVVVEGDTMQLLAEYLWLLDTLIRAGIEAEKADGPEFARKGTATAPPQALTSLLCLGDIAQVRDAIVQTITKGIQREVGAETPKNGAGAEAAASAPNG